MQLLSAHSVSWDDFELVPLSEVERMVKLRPWVSFRGARLSVERVYDGEGRMVWHPVQFGDPAYFASLLYVGPDTAGVSIAVVAEWPEFFGSDANYGGGVRGKVRLDRVEDYSEEFSEILIPGSPYTAESQAIDIVRFTMPPTAQAVNATGATTESATQDVPGEGFVDHPPFTGLGFANVAGPHMVPL
ncbi:hypothetical protein FHX49_001305 [Microbacterium endophyticum]|uniref:Uncharacterized protein n=1 Tax=Microbacterium endophyticum TaxID=1526412 RepID=A0A7W4V3Y4_9MICO|nr:hypothetical protein [Microbacterium endophyticum]MBB2975738.1 hypothetical protein [Microbacterium endophyticum]NIK36221.1 hypothetical protein [Microbacterium endophyticum]